ncbi:hypothetical protein [Novosphingobium sp. PASSN1]|uniref:hypothetical protein n=1 Tax=Novosphingobium sp. PASSN1 TaxID=2015561 RepID=UPI000BD04592|nr:hypothetical protein [Novosphingobium sp. PASSN1]OYU35258.1 MAG: hypothetical protein CFE35_09705 [Novosphingobium sp. PASSN1]
MGLVALGGAGHLFLSSPSTVFLFSSTPDEPWYFAPRECGYPNDTEYISDQEPPELNGREVALCFVAEKGDIYYAEAPPPKDAPQPPPPIGGASTGANRTPTQKWYWHGDSYDEPVKAYIEKRKADFVFTPDLIRQIRDGFSTLRWNRFTARCNEAAPFVFGTILILWLVAAVVGWIVRGFAGIPSGQDFRP